MYGVWGSRPQRATAAKIDSIRVERSDRLGRLTANQSPMSNCMSTHTHTHTHLSINARPNNSQSLQQASVSWLQRCLSVSLRAKLLTELQFSEQFEWSTSFRCDRYICTEQTTPARWIHAVLAALSQSLTQSPQLWVLAMRIHFLSVEFIVVFIQANDWTTVQWVVWCFDLYATTQIQKFIFNIWHMNLGWRASWSTWCCYKLKHSIHTTLCSLGLRPNNLVVWLVFIPRLCRRWPCWMPAANICHLFSRFSVAAFCLQGTDVLIIVRAAFNKYVNWYWWT